MKYFSFLICSILLIGCSATRNTVKSPDSMHENTKLSQEEQITAIFEGYKTAILNDQGPVAVELVDSRTIAYYEDMLSKTKQADSISVEQLNIMDKLMVFSIRHRTTKEKIESFDGKSLFVYAIEEGMIGKSSVSNNSIGAIEVNGDFAKGQLINQGSPAPIDFHFYREDGNWKLNLTSFFPMAAMTFQTMADESGQNENEYLFMLLEMITGNVPTSAIWNATSN